MESSSARPLPGLLSDERVLTRVVERMTDTFAGVFAAETIERYVLESYQLLGRSSRIRTHLVTNTERFTRERLTALAQADGLILRDVPEVLFVCVQNAGRSQIAAALMNHHAQGRVHVRSAGSIPAEGIEISVFEALHRLGVRLEFEFPKPLTDEVVRAADVVVTMGCGDSCPLFPGRRYVDWDVDDPAGRPVLETMGIAAALDRKVLDLLDELADERSG